MSWQGANVIRKKRSREQRQRSTETVEATLNRLSKSYTMAIECVGACHRAAMEINADIDSKKEKTLIGVARTARKTLEQAILADPLVRPHAPGLVQFWQEQLKQQKLRTSEQCHEVPLMRQIEPPLLTSQAHRSTVRKLSYLSLSNYAELLLSGCRRRPYKENYILDRPVVDPIFKHAQKDEFYMWSDEGQSQPYCDEHEKVTVRLALLAYLDALNLDGSDSTVWFKAAATARRLDRLQCKDGAVRRYRRLEQHALESAQSCWLSRDQPPNQLILKAWKEWQLSNASDRPISESFDVTLQSPREEVLRLSMNRYSWAVVGRTLLRACREGTNFRQNPNDSSSMQSALRLGVNPFVKLCMSPLLSMPARVLGNLIDWLSKSEVSALKCTCRGLSLGVVAAREKASQSKVAEKVQVQEKAETDDQNPPSINEKSDEAKSLASSKEEKATQASRVSKRLQSQILNSGRRAERKSRRTSVENCLVGACLGVSPAFSQKSSDDTLAKALKLPDKVEQSRPLTTGHEPQDDSRREALERVGPSSLMSFVEYMSDKAPTPLQATFHFLSHTSTHIDGVYACESHGSVVLSTCLMDALDLLVRRTGLDNSAPCWLLTKSQLSGISERDLFAVDLLHAEMRLKRCERDDTVDASFEGDIAFVASALPTLLSFAQSKEPSVGSTSKSFAKLQVRTYWLASTFYLWCSRAIHGAPSVREAESECLSFVQKITGTMKETGLVEVRTPHLEGTGRVGSYWEKLSPKTLSAFRTEIQASSVVLVAQDQFVDAISRVDNEAGLGTGSDCLQILASIGDALLQRYKSPAGVPNENSAELIDDFLSIHGSLMAVSPLSPAEDMIGWFRKVVPSLPPPLEELKTLKNPCILSILAICLSFRVDGRRAFADILLNLMLAIRDRRRELIASCDETGVDSDDASRTDDSSMGSEDDQEDQDHLVHEGVGSTLKIHARLLGLLAQSLEMVLDKEWLKSVAFNASSACLTSLVESAFAYTCDAATYKTVRDNDEITDDCFVLTRVIALLGKIENEIEENEGLRAAFNRCRLNQLVAVVIRHQRIVEVTLSEMQHNPTRRSKLRLIGGCQVLRNACCELGLILSTSLCTRLDKRLFRSPLLSDTSNLVLCEFCRSLLWLWDCSVIVDERPKKPMLPARQGKELRLPIAIAITALCGTAPFTNTNHHQDSAQPERNVQLMDLVDSDASVAGCVLEDEHFYEEMIRVIFQSVQCIALVTEALPDDEFFSGVSYSDGDSCKEKKPLPLVLERVANFFADTILLNPSGLDSEAEDNPLWGSYSRGTRSLGSQIDSFLHRAYRGLYGFALSQGNDALPLHSGSVESQAAKPDSISTVAQLYRCVTRSSRKAPPKAALLTIIAAMPETGKTAQSESLENFLFSSSGSSRFSTADIKMLVKQPSNCEMKFSAIKKYLDEANPSDIKKSQVSEAEILRRGIAEAYIEASLPPLDDNAEKDPRSQCAQMEKDLWGRFEVILHNITHNNCADCEGWFRIAQMCLFKANVIADRLGLSNGYTRSGDFMPSGKLTSIGQTQDLSGLVESQEKEVNLRSIGRADSLGSNLQLYMQHSWASFESLKVLQQRIGEDLMSSNNDEDDKSDLQIWNDISSLCADGKFALWEQCWGGIFVSSLRIMATKSMCLTLYLLQRELGLSDGARRRELIVENCEGLGTASYTEVVGSQWYGYPMQVMPQKVKRDIAETALVCYSNAIKVHGQKEVEENDNDSECSKSLWDLLFMMGKCHEKIAGTYVDEAFASPDSSRAYEAHMRSALESYASSLTHAQACEKDGSLLVEQQGGSSHGAMEALYRLHATRLKCLISAIQYGDDKREWAESEALRLTEPFPFSGETDKSSEGDSVRDRVWEVAVDVANAMVHCRTKHSFFHRSIYRHAQCLMWAPVLCNPRLLRSEGSFGEVPALKALKMRGLNSESAVESAAGVIRALFDKKRAQLCAVWVTTGSEFPFQGINNHVRKFDSLRGKYISAFVSCLDLCHKKDDLENFLRWINACRRDLPSHFSDTSGSSPPTGHVTDNLLLKSRSLPSHFFLTSVKRETNAALASSILHESKATRDSKALESHLKLSYSCLLRLNCSLDSLQKRRARRSRGVKQVVDALIAIHSSFSGSAPPTGAFDWSTDGQVCLLLDAAVKGCKELFPSLSGSFFTKKIQKRKKDASDKESENTAGMKRKEMDGTVLKQFNVKVPQGLSAGDTFITEINEGETIKRVKLTVPESEPSTLKFSIRVQERPGPSNKVPDSN